VSYAHEEIPRALSLTEQLRCRLALSLRRRCQCLYSCDCYAEEALLRLAAEGHTLYESQRVTLTRLLRGVR
jgi:hypothetical protein